MPLRSVARCLKESGLGCWALSDEPRFKIARQLLEDTELPLVQIAATLHFSEASAFACLPALSGCTPSQWRREGPDRHRLRAAALMLKNPG
jgi:transcriptional regulator GlxA family with amidase domain